MSIPYLFENFETEQTCVYLQEENVHYLLHVLRKQIGNEVILVNGKGAQLETTITQLSKKEGTLLVKKQNQFEFKTPQIHIAVSFTKNATRMEWFLEKATEIGIQKITPLITQRSEKIHFKQERFQKILISAMLQSQQHYLPILMPPNTLENAIECQEENRYIAYCGNEYEKQNLTSLIQASKDSIFLIGPEGDFTKEEVLLSIQKKFQPIQLGQNRLRTETAALYVCTLFNAFQ